MSEKQIGPHTVRVDGPILVLTIDGDISPDEMESIFAATDAHNTSQKHAATLLDVSRLGKIGSETRKVIGRRKQDPGLTACYGGSFAQRTLVGLMVRLINLVLPKPMEMGFFDSEDQARAWLDERRVAPG